MDGSPDPRRRGFLLAVAGRSAAPALRPPWTDEAAVAEACTRCGDCLGACPTAILVAGAGGFPAVDFTAGAGECTFCGACADACRDGVFAPAAGRPPWRAAAVLGEGCLARRGVMCQSCGDACPERAIRFRPARGAAPQPTVTQDCTGCGACVSACPADAVTVRPDLQEAPA